MYCYNNKPTTNYMKFIIQYKYTAIGLILGAISGYIYYLFIGCSNNNTCAITSSPTISTLYGALMIALLFNMFDNKNV